MAETFHDEMLAHLGAERAPFLLQFLALEDRINAVNRLIEYSDDYTAGELAAVLAHAKASPVSCTICDDYLGKERPRG